MKNITPHKAKQVLFSFTVGVALCCLASLANANKEMKEQERLEKSRELSEILQKALGQHLKNTISEHGVHDAIRVCAMDAPVIAEKISRESGTVVGRVSERARNPRNAASKEQGKILQDFAIQIKNDAQAAPEKLVKHKDGSYLYMRAIKTQALCLTCHGQNIDPDLSKYINTYYPDDKATGFALGELRGAFYVEWP